jgi:hypothetical protein
LVCCSHLLHGGCPTLASFARVGGKPAGGESGRVSGRNPVYSSPHRVAPTLRKKREGWGHPPGMVMPARVKTQRVCHRMGLGGTVNPEVVGHSSRNQRSHRIDPYASSPRGSYSRSCLLVGVGVMASQIIATSRWSRNPGHFPGYIFPRRHDSCYLWVRAHCRVCA